MRTVLSYISRWGAQLSAHKERALTLWERSHSGRDPKDGIFIHPFVREKNYTSSMTLLRPEHDLRGWAAGR